MPDDESNGHGETNGTNWKRAADRLASEKRQYKTRLVESKRELTDLRARVEAMEREREELKARADSSIHLKELERLRGEMRQGKHRQVFNDLALKLGANPKALDDVFSSSGWKADTDEVDVETMGSAISEVLANKDYLKASVSWDGVPPAAQGKDRSRLPKPAPAGGRGGRVDGVGPQIDLERAKSDPAYASKHYEAYLAACKLEAEEYGA